MWVPSAPSAQFVAYCAEYLLRSLPDFHAWPSAIVEMAALPMDGKTEKLDRKAPAPRPILVLAPAAPEGSRNAFGAAKSPQSWSRALGVPDVSVTTNFFRSGWARPLQMFAVLSDMQLSIHSQLQMNDLFEREPTIRAQANLIRGKRSPDETGGGRPTSPSAATKPRRFARIKQRRPAGTRD